MKKMLTFLLFLFTSVIFANDTLDEIDENLRLHQITFLCAHNAYSTKKTFNGYGPYRQQDLSIEEQLNHGVRSLMLDAYWSRRDDLISRLTLGRSALSEKISQLETELDKKSNSFIWAKICKCFGFMLKPIQKIAQELNASEEFSQKIENFINFVQGSNDYIALCHNNCQLDILLRNLQLPEPLTDQLKVVKKWLVEHPKEVVSLIFETDSEEKGGLSAQDFEGIIEESDLHQVVLKPTDYNPETQEGWPTLKWLRENNKRLLVFANRPEQDTKYTWQQWRYMQESEYSTVKKEEIAKERAESTRFSSYPRHLLLMNIFPKGPIPFNLIDDLRNGRILEAIENGDKEIESIKAENVNSYDNLMEIIRYCKENALGRNPNILALDFVNKGEPVRVVNELNKY